MNPEILNIILKDALTLTQFKHKLKLLKSHLLKLFFGNSNNLPVSPQDSNWLKSLPESFYQNFNKDNVYKIFSDLEEQSKKMEVLVMYLTFEPNDITLHQINSYIKKTFSSTFLLDIKFDPSLIAGTAMVWKGILRDYSLRASIEDKKGEIVEEFKRFRR